LRSSFVGWETFATSVRTFKNMNYYKYTSMRPEDKWFFAWLV